MSHGLRFRKAFPRLLALPFWLAASSGAWGGGVTVITHGFSGNITDWILPMAAEMPGYPGFPGADLTCYDVDIEKSVSSYRYEVRLLDGPQPQLGDSGEIVIKLDWSSVATDLSTSSTDVAEAAALALLDPDFQAQLGGRPLVELPLHLIGYSRGASVVSDICRELGERGVWVDHLTLLDPVPVGTPYGDAAISIYENVLYADNFYQSLGGFLTPMGTSYPGCFNRNLTRLDGGYSGSFSNHYDPHLWYHGTIGLATPTSDTQATLGANERALWYADAENEGRTAGFHYSRIGGGDRLATLVPVDGTSASIRDGYNRRWDLGAGAGNNNRSALPQFVPEWPNLITLDRPSPGTVGEGETIELQMRYQCGGTGGTVTPFLDRDRNPWNANEWEFEEFAVSPTGAGAVAAVDVSMTMPAASAGRWAAGMMIESNGNRRYLYLGSDLVVAPRARILTESAGYDGNVFSFAVVGPAGQTFVLEASTDLKHWEIIETITLDGDESTVTDGAAAGQDQRFYRLRGADF